MKKVKAGKSKIHGNGLIADEPIRRGDVIELVHTIREIEPGVKKTTPTLLGRNYNHSEEPNSINVIDGNNRYLVALKEIEVGGEITTDYRNNPDLEQPDSFTSNDNYISFDYDDTLTTPEGFKLAKQMVKDGNNLYVITARDKMSPQMIERAEAAGIPKENIILAGSDEQKVKIVKENNISKHIDNKESVIKALGKTGELFNPGEYPDLKADFIEMDLSDEELNQLKKGGFIIDQYPDGGITTQQEIDVANKAMMKAKLAYADMQGNPAAKRMIVAPDKPYDFGNGMIGTHYMASMDDYAVPQIQDVNGQLILGDYGPDSAEAIKFDNPEDAQYFAENYKNVSPAFLNEKKKGGIIKYPDGGQPRPVQGMVKPLAPLAIRKEQVKPLKNSPKVADQKKYKAVQDEVKAIESIQKASKQLDELQKDALPQYEQPLDMMDYAWTGAVAAPAMLPEIGAALATNIPGTGITYGTALNAAGGIHGITSVPDRVQDWQDFASGKKTWQEATAKTLGTGLELYGGYDAVNKGLNFAKEIYDAGKGSNIFFNLSDEAKAARKLQDIGLLGKGVDPKIFGRYPQLAQNATKRLLKDYNTSYRAVNPIAEKMSLDDMVNMAKSGYNIEDPMQVAEYMSTTVPINNTGAYRAGLDLHPSQDALYTGKFKTAEEAAQNLRGYGKYMSEVRPPMDFSEGNLNQWIDQHYTNKLFGMTGDPNSKYVLLRNREAYQPGGLFKPGAVGFSKDSEYWPYIGNKGEKLLEKIRTYDLDSDVLNSNARREALNQEYTQSQLPGSPNTFKSSLGGMDMSRYEIKNPDYFTQLLNTYDSRALSAANKKFYKGLINSVKKNNGIATERQYNELQRLKTGNFNFGKKGYSDGGLINQFENLRTNSKLNKFIR